jgi:hypothetical protein
MLAIRLPANIEKRLVRLAKRTGRTKTFYAGEASLNAWRTWKPYIWPNGGWRGFAPAAEKPFPSTK